MVSAKRLWTMKLMTEFCEKNWKRHGLHKLPEKASWRVRLIAYVGECVHARWRHFGGHTVTVLTVR